MSNEQNQNPVMHTRQVEVEITAVDFAKIFANSNSGKQAAFLVALAGEIKTWKNLWAFQCNHIVDEMSPEQKVDVGLIVNTLAEILN